MKIIFLGDSITDMGRTNEPEHVAIGYGVGYPNMIIGELSYAHPGKYQFLNRGINGNRVVDLRARIQEDVWNHNPELLSILIGINDTWYDREEKEEIALRYFEREYRMLLGDTKGKLPNIKFILCEPFVLKYGAGDGGEKWKRLLRVKQYAKVVKKLAQEFDAYFVPLQEILDEAAANYSVEYYLYDGMHTTAAGAKLIATEWLKTFKTIK